MTSDKSKKLSFPPMVGGSSLLIIFAVLCLTIFTLLALGTVQADNRLLSASASAVTSYYAADTEAEQIFAELRAGHLPEQVEKRGSVYAYSCPVSDTQVLMVELQKKDRNWIILKWQTQSTVTY